MDKYLIKSDRSKNVKSSGKLLDRSESVKENAEKNTNEINVGNTVKDREDKQCIFIAVDELADNGKALEEICEVQFVEKLHQEIPDQLVEEECSKRSAKKIKVTQKYRIEYTNEWPCLIQSKLSAEYVYCTVCCKDFTISHGGRDDCKRHIGAKSHLTYANAEKEKKKMAAFLNTKDDENSVIKSELYFAKFISEHNLPISCADHAGPLFKKMFPDSKIAASYSSCRTKTTSLLKCLASSTQEDIIQVLKTKPFALSTDGSNDKNNAKLYPVVVTYFSDIEGKIVNMILSILECTDNTGLGIFNVINSEFTAKNIPWLNCVAFASDNAKAMNGHIKGVLAFIKQHQPNINYQGCVCHLLHLAAKKGCMAIQHFNIEDFLINIYYFLQNSSKRQNAFEMCQDVYGMKPHKILKYVSTRWLSMHECIKRVLEQWNPLLDFFSEENDCNNEKFLLIKSHLENPATKLYLLFLKSVLPLFLSVNTFLQQEKPLIHKVNKVLNDLLFSLIARFIKPSAVDNHCSSSLISIACDKRKNQKSDSDLVIGADTRALLKGIPSDVAETFYKDVRNFYVKSVDYIKEKFPINNLFLQHAEIADISLRKKKKYSSVEFLIEEFPNVLKSEEKALLEMEFSQYQFENFDEFDLEKERIDTIWHKISQITDGNGGAKYIALPKLILALLLVPHSNATTERVFSLVRKNQTDFRPNLGTETLTYLLIEKQKNINKNNKCYETKFSSQLLKAAKKATWADLNKSKPSTSAQ